MQFGVSRIYMKKEGRFFHCTHNVTLVFHVLSTQLRLNCTTNSSEFQHRSTHNEYLKSWLTYKFTQIRSFRSAELTDLNLSIKLPITFFYVQDAGKRSVHTTLTQWHYISRKRLSPFSYKKTKSLITVNFFLLQKSLTLSHKSQSVFGIPFLYLSEKWNST